MVKIVLKIKNRVRINDRKINGCENGVSFYNSFKFTVMIVELQYAFVVNIVPLEDVNVPT